MKKVIIYIILAGTVALWGPPAGAAMQELAPGTMVPPGHWAVKVLDGLNGWRPITKNNLRETFEARVKERGLISRSMLAAVTIDYLTEGGFRPPRLVIPEIPGTVLPNLSRVIMFLREELERLTIDVPQVLAHVDHALEVRKEEWGKETVKPELILAGVQTIPDPDTVSPEVLPRLVDFEVTPAFISLQTDGTFTFKAIGTTEDGFELYLEPKWHVTGGVGRIDGKGVFTATDHGTGMVTAYVRDHDDFTSYAIVRVEPQAPVRIDVQPGKVLLQPGETLEFSAAGFDEADRRVPVQVEWSLEGENGVLDRAEFTAGEPPGVGFITATTPDGTVCGSAEVIVKFQDEGAAVVEDTRERETTGSETGKTVTAADTQDTPEPMSGAAEAPTGASEDSLLERKVSLDYIDMELVDVLRMLFMETGTRLNMSIPAKVQREMKGKKLSGHYRDTRFGDILDFLTKNNGFSYTIKEKTVLIKKLDRSEQVTEVVPLEFAEVSYVEEMLNRMRVRNVTVSADTRLNGIIIQGQYANMDSIEEVRSMVEKLDIPENRSVTEIFEVKYMDLQKVVQIITPLKSARQGQIVADENGRSIFVSDIAGNVEKMRDLIKKLDVRRLSTRVIELKHSTFDDIQKIKQSIEQGAFGDARSIKINANEKTNSLIVTAPDDTIDKVEDFIAMMDQETKQVVIEAKIVEVTLDSDDQFGIDWDLLLPQRGSRKSADEENKVEVSLPVGSSTGSFKFGTIAVDQFSMFLELLEKSHKVRLLSSPTLVAMNNQKAFLNQGDTQPVPKYTYNDQVGKYEVSGYEEKTSGIQLDVTPTIYDDYIVMDVHPKVTNFTGSSKTRFGDDIPTTNTRETQTRVMVQDGDTLIISGMIQEKEERSYQKIPILGDLPVLKKIFSSRKKTKQKTDTVVFLSPRVVKSSGSMIAKTGESEVAQ